MKQPQEPASARSLPGEKLVAGMRAVTLRSLLAAAMLLVLVGSLVAWYLTRETLPPKIRIATAAPGGLYHKLGTVLAPHLEKKSGRPVEVRPTLGSVENRRLLLAGEADLAILQLGAVDLDGIAALTPLYHDLVFAIVRSGSEIEDLGALAGRNVSLGPAGSGMRESARGVLRHYSIEVADLGETERYFLDLASDPAIDAAVVTSGLINPDLDSLLATGDFRILPVLDAEAISLRNPHFTPATVPRGFYHEGPPVPQEPVPTVRTTSLLAAREGASGLLVEAVLAALYENRLRGEIPTLVSRHEAAEWDEAPIHAAARAFFQPFSGLGILANFMETLAAVKELLFALGAGIYLIWTRWQRNRKRSLAEEARREKEYLDSFLEETIRIERAQMETEDPAELQAFLNEVTEIKLRALVELTHEDLRGDVAFSIFLQQCSNLIRKIQGKLLLARTAPTDSPEPAELPSVPSEPPAH